MFSLRCHHDECRGCSQWTSLQNAMTTGKDHYKNTGHYGVIHSISGEIIPLIGIPRIDLPFNGLRQQG